MSRHTPGRGRPLTEASPKFKRLCHATLPMNLLQPIICVLVFSQSRYSATGQQLASFRIAGNSERRASVIESGALPGPEVVLSLRYGELGYELALRMRRTPSLGSLVQPSGWQQQVPVARGGRLGPSGST